MVGAIADAGTRRDVCTALSVPQMIPSLDKIAEAAAKKDEVIAETQKKNANGTNASETEIVGSMDNMYSHAFLCGLDRNKYGIVKVVLPKEIAKSKLFFTGVAQNKKLKKG